MPITHKINVVIIDDEDLAVQLLEDYCSKTVGVSVVGAYTNPIIALEALNTSIKADLIFLDIQMPQMNGLDFIENLKQNSIVVLTTSYEQYAIKAFELNVLDYLHKPYLLERFQKSIRKYKELYSFKTGRDDAEKYIFVQSEYFQEKILIDDILYVEGLGQHLQIRTLEKVTYTIMTFQKIEELLPNYFVRAHKSYVVNAQKVTQFNKTKLCVGSKEITMGRVFKKEAFERIQAIHSTP